MKKILLIGAGNMGSAIGKILLASNIISPSDFFISDKHSSNLEYFKERKCNVSLSPNDFLKKSDIVILAIKPQILRESLIQWKKILKKNVLLLSIAAGVSCTEIQKYSELHRCVRIMPNTPLLVGKGTSGYFFSGIFSESEQQNITKIIESFGLSIKCKNENQINAITALSGSGPAYFFRLLKLMSDQGQSFGFTQEESDKIALQTLQGAGVLAEKSEDDFKTLRKKVTSNGGTTEAALNFFEKNNLEEIWKGGIIAAKKRAEEL